MNKNASSITDNGYVAFDSALKVHQAVNGSIDCKPVNIDILSNEREFYYSMEHAYSENNSNQEAILGLYGAIIHAIFSGVTVQTEVISYNANPLKKGPETAIGVLLADTNMTNGCLNEKTMEVELPVVTIGGNRAGIILKKDGSVPVLLPIPTFRVRYPKSIGENPFIRSLTDEEQVMNILKKEGLPTDIMDRIEERRFTGTVQEIKKYDLVSRKLRAYIQLNKLDSSFRMLSDVLKELGGALSEEELKKEKEEVKNEFLSDDLNHLSERMGISNILSMQASFGNEDSTRKGVRIFSRLLPVVPSNGHTEEEFLYTSRTDQLEPEAMTLCPVNNTLIPVADKDVSVTYEFSKAPDPVTCLVSFTNNGKTVRRRYGIEEFVQLRLPVVITPFRGADPTVPMATYRYLFDEATDPALKNRVTGKVLSDLTVDIPVADTGNV